MTLQTNQVNIYSITTSAFYTEQEKEIKKKQHSVLNHKKDLADLNKRIDSLTSKVEKCIDEKVKGELETILSKLNDKKEKMITEYENYMKEFPEKKKGEIKELINNEFYKEMESTDTIRELNQKKLIPDNIVGQFESTFTRTLEINNDDVSEEFMIVTTYYKEIMKQLIEKGYMHKGEKYVFLFCSSGQIRTKRNVFIKESKLKEVSNQLFMGLTQEYINDNGGMSVNKYIAYLALVSSSSLKWDIDLSKAIVVDDFVHMIKDKNVEEVDKTYNIKPNTIDIEFNVMDGCGIMLPSVSDVNLQVRGAGGFKGLLSPFDFRKFVLNTDGASTKVTDIYNKEWDIIEDDIKIIFTKSQFKFYRYFKSWKEYQDKFEGYNCEFAIANRDSLDVSKFEQIKPLNYQMIQTLTDVSDAELKQLVTLTNKRIGSVGDSVGDALNTLKADDNNEHKRPIHNALILHNELLNDPYIKKMIKEKKKTLVKNARAGGIYLEGTKRTYLIPDLYAFAQHLFKLDVTGLIEDGNVYCKLYGNDNELDVLRSPHLALNEHCIRTNAITEQMEEWYTTNGIYTSIHDEMAKILMFDNDGDEALIVSNKLFVEIAKRHVEGLVSLDYELGVSEPEDINHTTIFESLNAAYEANIGEISNNITKLLNQDIITDKDKITLKQLVYLSNQTIDYAKTKWLAEVPVNVQEQFDILQKGKLPHFFKYAKGKTKINKANKSTMNRLAGMISNKRINFQFDGLEKGEFDYSVLLSNINVDIESESATKIIDKFKELTRYTNINKTSEDNQGNEQFYIIKYIRDEMKKVEPKLNVVVDTLTKYLYERNTENKQYLWDCYGHILLENLEFNKGIKKKCEMCDSLFEKEKKNQRYCSDECSKKASRIKAALRKQEQRKREANAS